MRIPAPLVSTLLIMTLASPTAGCGEAVEARPEKRFEAEVDLLGRFADCRNWRERSDIDLGRPFSRRHLGEGFAEDEREAGDTSFVWAIREQVEIHFMVSEARPTRVTLRMRPFRPEGHPPQRMHISLNGEPAAEVTLVAGFEDYGIPLPEYVLRRGRNTLRFDFSYAVSPAGDSTEEGGDRRTLAAAFDRMSFARFSDGRMPWRNENGRLTIPAGSAAVFEIPEPGARVVILEGVENTGGALLVDLAPSDPTSELIGRITGTAPRVILPLPSAGEEPRRLRLIAAGEGPITLAGVAAGSVVSEHKRAPAPPPAERPHVIVYLVDTLRRDRVGAFGGSRELTPNIDAFADGAITMADAHAQAPWTKPAVASLFTGLNATRHGVNRYGSVLPAEAFTLAEAMRDAGYATMAVSGSAAIRELAGFSQGFEVFEEVGEEANGSGWPASPLILDRLDAMLSSRADGRPLFLYVHTTDPHSPYAPPGAYRRRFARDAQRQSIRAGQLRPELREESLALYDAEVAFADDGFRRFLETLERHHLRDEAFVLFIADHGEQFHEHGGWRHSSNHAEVIRIPMILDTPDALGLQAREISSIVRQVDLFPTLSAMIGFAGPTEPHGRDLSALLRGDLETPEEAPESLSYIWRSDRRDHSIVDHPWKLMLRLRPDGDVVRRLYRIADDPEERHDVAAEHPEVIERLERLLRSGSVDIHPAYSDGGPGAGSEDVAVHDELDAQLRALGYVD